VRSTTSRGTKMFKICCDCLSEVAVILRMRRLIIAVGLRTHGMQLQQVLRRLAPIAQLVVFCELCRHLAASLVVHAVSPLTAIGSATLVAWNYLPRTLLVKRLQHSIRLQSCFQHRVQTILTPSNAATVDAWFLAHGLQIQAFQTRIEKGVAS